MVLIREREREKCRINGSECITITITWPIGKGGKGGVGCSNLGIQGQGSEMMGARKKKKKFFLFLFWWYIIGFMVAALAVFVSGKMEFKKKKKKI